MKQVYIAWDGRSFNNMDDCMQYEAKLDENKLGDKDLVIYAQVHLGLYDVDLVKVEPDELDQYIRHVFLIKIKTQRAADYVEEIYRKNKLESPTDMAFANPGGVYIDNNKSLYKEWKSASDIIQECLHHITHGVASVELFEELGVDLSAIFEEWLDKFRENNLY